MPPSAPTEEGTLLMCERSVITIVPITTPNIAVMIGSSIVTAEPKVSSSTISAAAIPIANER